MINIHVRHRLKAFTLDVAFEAQAGVTALFGPSGSGKTTLINAVAGLLRPDEATLGINGRDLAALPPAQRRIGYVFQEARLFPHMTVKSNLLYGWRHRGGHALPPRFEETVALLGIDHLLSRRPFALSGGEKQRIAIGRALLSQPDLLLMDEPLAALDDSRKAELLPYLETLCRSSALPILYVSHALSEITRLANRLVILQAGRSIASGTVADLLSRPELAPHLGLSALGSLLQGEALHYEAGLTTFRTAAGPLHISGPAPLTPNSQIRIAAQDVLLALSKPEGLSALNILPATVLSLQDDHEGGCLVRLRCNEAILLSRVTAHSAQRLGLAAGTNLYAIVKSVTLRLG